MPAVKWSGAGCEMGADRVTERQVDTSHHVGFTLTCPASLSVSGRRAGGGEEGERRHITGHPGPGRIK